MLRLHEQAREFERHRLRQVERELKDANAELAIFHELEPHLGIPQREDLVAEKIQELRRYREAKARP